MEDGLYQVTDSFICAGVVVKGGQIVEAAPIYKWLIGKTINYLYIWASMKRRKVTRIGNA